MTVDQCRQFQAEATHGWFLVGGALKNHTKAFFNIETETRTSYSGFVVWSSDIQAATQKPEAPLFGLEFLSWRALNNHTKAPIQTEKRRIEWFTTTLRDLELLFAKRRRAVLRGFLPLRSENGLDSFRPRRAWKGRQHTFPHSGITLVG